MTYVPASMDEGVKVTRQGAPMRFGLAIHLPHRIRPSQERQERAFGTPNGRPDHVLGDFGSVSSTVRPSGSRMTKDQ
jgi:hypothetical protein